MKLAPEIIQTSLPFNLMQYLEQQTYEYPKLNQTNQFVILDCSRGSTDIVKNWYSIWITHPYILNLHWYLLRIWWTRSKALYRTENYGPAENMRLFRLTWSVSSMVNLNRNSNRQEIISSPLAYIPGRLRKPFNRG